MRKFTTHIYTKANYLLNRGRMALSNQRGDFYISGQFAELLQLAPFFICR